MVILLLFVTVLAFSLPSVRIKDIAYISGIRENQLLGIGLVTGLSGKGDSQGSGLLKGALSNLLANFSIEVDAKDLRSKNCAVVMVSMELPSFARPGDRIDVTVSSIGDARSVEGGILLQTNMKAANGNVYVVAQGKVLVPPANSQSKTVGSIPGGGIVEREILTSYITNDYIKIVLRNPDFVTVTAVAQAITEAFPGIELKSVDSAMVEVKLPEGQRNNPVSFIASLESLNVVPDAAGKVVIDAATGVIIIGENVKIGKVAVSYKQVSATVGFSFLTEDLNPENFVIEDTTSVNDLVDLLKKVGLKTDVIIGILQAIEKAGALFGDLVIM